MNRFSKLLASALAIAMCLGTGTTAFAAETPEETPTAVVEEVGTYTPEEIASFEESNMVEPRVATISQFKVEGWYPAGAKTLKVKDAAPQSGTLLLMIGAKCNEQNAPHSNDNLHVVIKSGLVKLISIDVPSDGKTHVYRFDGNDNPKVKIVKGNNYTTEISGPYGCLNMNMAGSVIVE